MQTKKCPICGQEKEMSPKFWKTYNQRRAKSGKIYSYTNYNKCLTCFNEKRRLTLDKEVKKLYDKRYRRKHKEKLLQKSRAIWKAKADIFNARRRAANAANPELRQRNIDRVTNYRKKNVWYRINCYVGNYVRMKIHDKDFCSTFSILGYSLQELISHLEKQFTEGMSWDNYGQWHIDHIKPVCSFRFASKEDPAFKECWSLNNLRPLWAKDNLQKSAQDKLLKA